jgi:anaerobic selenocysteine-containing dehydrogenase
MVRMHGCNNLPDCSNMCHESTSVGLKESIGVPVGTVTLDDFHRTDCLLFFGENVGTNAPRMLHDLQAARRRGVPIITFNPLRERDSSTSSIRCPRSRCWRRNRTMIGRHDDPYREVHGGRRVLLMNAQDMKRLGIEEGQRVTVTGCSADAVRKVPDLRVIAYDIPEGCAGGYYRECNPLIPAWHRAMRSHVPAAKFVAVRVAVAGNDNA